VTEGPTSEQIARPGVERDTVRDPPSRYCHQLVADQPRVALGPGRAAGLPVDERRQNATARHHGAVCVHGLVRPEDVPAAHEAQRGSDLIGRLETQLNAAILVKPDRAAQIARPRCKDGVVLHGTDGGDLGAPVEEICRVGIEHLVEVDVLPQGVLSSVTGRPHRQALEEHRSELVARADIDQPCADLGRVLGTVCRYIARAVTQNAVGWRHRVEGVATAELVEHGGIERERARSPAPIHPDRVSVLMDASAHAVGSGYVFGREGTAAGGAVGRRGGGDAVTTPAHARCRAGRPVGEEVRVHRLELKPLGDAGELGGNDQCEIVAATLRDV